MYVLLSCSSFSPNANRVNLLSDSGDVAQASSLPRFGRFSRKRLSFLIALPIPMTSRSFLDCSLNSSFMLIDLVSVSWAHNLRQ